ncbi:MAG: helix-turn-helix domain-containing protein [Lachnospiraceae bacterium]
MDYITYEYHNPDLCVEELCSICSLDITELNHHFQCEFEMDALDYIHYARFEHAKECMFRIKKQTLQDVAESCGYKNAEAMQEEFIKRLGCTPFEFRQKYTDDEML